MRFSWPSPSWGPRMSEETNRRAPEAIERDFARTAATDKKGRGLALGAAAAAAVAFLGVAWRARSR